MISIEARLRKLEAVLGKGPTYPKSIQQKILDGTPEFLFRGVLLGKGRALAERCAKAIEYLDRSGPIPAEQRDEALSRLAELEREVEALTKECLRA
jgi:hypothetical protein